MNQTTELHDVLRKGYVDLHVRLPNANAKCPNANSDADIHNIISHAVVTAAPDGALRFVNLSSVSTLRDALGYLPALLLTLDSYRLSFRTVWSSKYAT